MTINQLTALLPIIALALMTVTVMLVSAFNTSQRLLSSLTLLGAVVPLMLLFMALDVAPIQVTPLLLVDGFALFYSGLILATGVVVILLAADYFAGAAAVGMRLAEYYILLLVALLGALVLVSANHFAAFFMGLELLGVALYVLVGYLAPGQDGRGASLEAGIKYLILSGVASALLLFGMALLYAEFGTLSFSELGRHWQHNGALLGNLYAAVGMGLLLSGVAFKLSLVPFHMWTPDIYQGAPAPTAAFVATVSKGALFALLLRFFIMTGAFQHQLIWLALALFAIASMLVGNLLALMQNNVKRLLAYSSIAHMGYLMVAFLAGGSNAGVPVAVVNEAVGFYLVAYFITTLGAFAVVSLLSGMTAATDFDQLDQYTGLFWRAPWLAAVLTVMLLSLAGIPLTVGFIGKFYLFVAGTEGMLWWLLAALILGSVIGLFYYLRWIVVIFKAAPQQAEVEPLSRLSATAGVTLFVLAAALIWLGVYPAPLISLLRVV